MVCFISLYCNFIYLFDYLFHNFIHLFNLFCFFITVSFILKWLPYIARLNISIFRKKKKRKDYTLFLCKKSEHSKSKNKLDPSPSPLKIGRDFVFYISTLDSRTTFVHERKTGHFVRQLEKPINEYTAESELASLSFGFRRLHLEGVQSSANREGFTLSFIFVESSTL